MPVIGSVFVILLGNFDRLLCFTVIKSEIEAVTNAPFFTIIAATVLGSLLCLFHKIFYSSEMFRTEDTYIS
jgi:hypothetical protein